MAYVLISILFSATLCAQQLSPPIRNHTFMEYSAASQNWDIAIDEEGVVYSANHKGLLTFDGQQWELFPLENDGIIRSVYIHEGRIYTGSYREFGYWTRDQTGKLFYTSLMSLFQEGQVPNEEFWEILAHNGALYFRSFGAVFKYSEDKIETVTRVNASEMVVYKDRLLLALDGQGLFHLNRYGELEALLSQDSIAGERVVDMEVLDDMLLIGTKKALYQFDGSKGVLYPDPMLNRELQASELNHILRISNEDLLLGTIKSGVLHYNIQSGNQKVYNRNNGLQNNTVLGMEMHEGKVWLSLDNGIDEIALDSPIAFYTEETGELGTVYDLSFYKGNLYIGSNTGIYQALGDEIQLLSGAAGHTWGLEEIDGVLFSNHNSGTFKIINDSFIPVDTRTGSFQIQKSPYHEELYFIGNYTGISTYSSRDGSVSEISGIRFPVENMVFQDSHTLWVSHAYEGLFQVSLDEKLQTAEKVERYNVGGKREDYKYYLAKIHDQIAAFRNGIWYRYNVFKDSLEVFPEMEEFRNYKLLLQDENGFWFSETDSGALRYTDFSGNDVVVPIESLHGRLVKDNEEVIKYDDSLYFVSLSDGFAQINLKKLLSASKNQELPVPEIKGVSDADQRYELTKVPEVPFQHSSRISFEVSMPNATALDLRYELEGKGELSGKIINGYLEFQNLPEGSYTLYLYSHNSKGDISRKASFDFQVLPPWYASGLAKVGYLFLLFVLLGLIFVYNKRKLKKQEWLLQERFRKEREEDLRQLEKERLMNEINVKRKELANTTMLAAKKNEVLMEVQEELKKDKNKFSNQFRLKHIMTKINQAVQNKDEWKVFETNFNELHEDFFKDLLREFPDLSSKDLKLCSYLKMNLTSKEIAPLMGISVRGVEIHRYRLRKKMELDSKENLSNYLIKNF